MSRFQDLETFIASVISTQDTGPPACPGIVILTGAGISAESGLGTFRGQSGLWEQYNLEDVATPQAFKSNPHLVHKFYNQRRAQLFDTDIQPNAAHKSLAGLQKKAANVTLVTQNVDNLHERAGSPDVWHMHGTLFELLCLHCKEKTPVTNNTVTISAQSRCSSCQKDGGLRPAVVWFGEMPLHMEAIHISLARCGLFISIGTSGHVYPAAGFVQTAAQAGAHTLEINLEPSQNAGAFDFGIYGRATEKVPFFINKLLESTV